MEKITELGTIKISDNVFEKMIKDGLALTKGRDSLALERRNIIIEEKDGILYIEFHVVHKFGTSMLFSSGTVLDHLEDGIRALHLGVPVRITMRIVAVRARRSIRSNHEITRNIR